MTALVVGARTSPALAHGGGEASAILLVPDEPGVVVSEQFRLVWLDASDLGTATASTTHDFFYSSRIPPPWPIFSPPDGLEGTPIARGIPESEPVNALEWNTSTVAPGAYWIWSIANDPDLLTPEATIIFSPFPVVVAHPGDPVHPFVTLQTPDSPAAYAEGDRYEVEYVVFDPDESASVVLERALDGTDDWIEVQAALPPRSESSTLDTRTWGEGDWVLRARLTDARGLTFTAFARFTLLVARAPDRPDAGLVLDAGPRPDAGTPPGPRRSAPPASEGCRCRGARSGTSLALVLPLLALLFARLRSRSVLEPIRLRRTDPVVGTDRASRYS